MQSEAIIVLFSFSFSLTEKSADSNMGMGVFLSGQPRHCICTNASRGLSAQLSLLFNMTVGCHMQPNKLYLISDTSDE